MTPELRILRIVVNLGYGIVERKRTSRMIVKKGGFVNRFVL